MTHKRVLMIGLDGLEIGIVRRALAAGRLPNIGAWIAGSRELAVHSDGETFEGSVWPTFTTGLGPGQHGHHWFYHWAPSEARFVPSVHSDYSLEPFWTSALNAGRRVIEFDVPYLLAFGHANARSYNGWGVQDEMNEFASPREFRTEILKKYGRSKVNKDTLLVRSPDDRLRLARRLRAGLRQRSQLFRDLVAARDWDFAVMIVGETHLAGHHLAVPMDLSPKVTNETAMYGILRPLDDAWPDIVSAAGDDCDIVLFALHGMRPKVAYGETVNGILRKMDDRPPPAQPKRDLVRRLRDLLPQSLHQAIWLRLPAETRMARVMEGWLARMDLEHDRAFVFEGDCAVAIRLNIQGRERTGILPEANARAFLDEILREAERYSADDGQQAFVGMKIAADVFSGPRLNLLPDAALLYNSKVIATTGITRDDGFRIDLMNEPSRNGSHTGLGFAFYRASGDAHILRDEIDSRDLAPTILKRLGVEPTTSLEGDAFMG